MASYSDKTYSGTLTTSSVSVATIAASTTFILIGISVSNANAAAKKAEILIDDIRILPYVIGIPIGDSLILKDLNLPVTTGVTIKLKGEVANDMDYYIWGVNYDYS